MNRRLTIACICYATGVVMLLSGARIYAKARVGQFLLQRAWTRTLHGEREVKPWGWADTWPVARIEFPRQHRDYIVLAGASGRTMAWGPGHVDGTAMPGEAGNCVISAHRDTHFSTLRYVGLGDDIVVETPDGTRMRYRVFAHRVTNDRDTHLLEPGNGRVLTLITCYPFDAVRPGGHLRYVIQARGGTLFADEAQRCRRSRLPSSTMTPPSAGSSDSSCIAQATRRSS